MLCGQGCKVKCLKVALNRKGLRLRKHEIICSIVSFESSPESEGIKTTSAQVGRLAYLFESSPESEGIKTSHPDASSTY